MGKKLYIGGLSYDTTNTSLSEAFAPHGQVESADVVMDRYTGRSRGFGFVEMSTAAEATKAIQGLNGTTLDGRQITVAEARPREDRRGGGGGRNRW